jgi:hypothetical protein
VTKFVQGEARNGHRKPPPAAPVALVRSVTRGVPLAPAAELVTARRRWRLTDSDGRVLLEVVDDHAAVFHTIGAAPGQPPHG